MLRAPSRVVAYNIAKVQIVRCGAFSVEVLWHGSMEWRFSAWNGRKLPVWNREKSSFIPCPAKKNTLFPEEKT